MRYHDGTAIEAEKFNQTTRELGDRFGGLAQDFLGVQGIWIYQGMSFRDTLIRIRIDSGDPKATAFLKKYKEKLKDRFRQLDIWITAHEIEII